MKLSFHVTVALLYLFLLTSCNQTPEAIVKDVTMDFAKAFYNLNLEKAQKYTTFSSKTFISLLASNIDQEDIEKIKKAGGASVEIMDVVLENNGETAIVKCKITNYLKLNFIKGVSTIEKEFEKELNLIKYEDKWLIDLHP